MATRIRHIMGNVLRLCIPLRVKTVTLVDGRATATDAPFTPNPEYPVSVVLSNGAQNFKLLATMTQGNIAVVEDRGLLPLGTYSVAVLCKDGEGNPMRFKEANSLQIVGYTSEACICGGGTAEVETCYLNAAIFMALKGDKGDPGDPGRGIQSIETHESQENGGYNVVIITLTDGTTTELKVKNGDWYGLVDEALSTESSNPIANAAVSNKFDDMVYVSNEQLIISNAI